MAPLRRLAVVLAIVLGGTLSIAAAPALASLIVDLTGSTGPMSAETEAAADQPLDGDDLLRSRDEAASKIALEDPLHPPTTFGGADEDAQSPTAVAVLYEIGGSHRPPIPPEQKRDCLCRNPPERSYDAQAPPHR